MLPTAEALEGRPVPPVTFKARPNDQWRDITTDELFKGRTVALRLRDLERLDRDQSQSEEQAFLGSGHTV